MAYLMIDGTDSAVKLFIDRKFARQDEPQIDIWNLTADLRERFGFNPSYVVDSPNSVSDKWIHYEIRNGNVIEYNY